MRAIGGQYEYSNSAEYQIGKPRTLCAAGGQTPSAPGSQASPSQTLPPVPERDQLRADEGEQPSAAAPKSLCARGHPDR